MTFTETVAPLPTCIVSSFLASSLKDLRSCKEEQTCLVAPESIIQEEVLTSTNIASKSCKSVHRFDDSSHPIRLSIWGNCVSNALARHSGWAIGLIFERA